MSFDVGRRLLPERVSTPSNDASGGRHSSISLSRSFRQLTDILPFTLFSQLRIQDDQLVRGNAPVIVRMRN